MPSEKEPQKETFTMKGTMKNKPDEYNYMPNQKKIVKESFGKKIDNYTYIPSSENIIKEEKEEKINKYIPSQVGAKFPKTFDNSGLDAALKKADCAEKKAIQILSGNFNGM